MQAVDFTITENKKIARDVYRMRLSTALPPVMSAALNCQSSIEPRPGQFVNLAIDGCYLRRPISVCDWDGERLTLIYKVVGEGTKKLAGYQENQSLNLLTGLGNGYSAVKAQRPLLIGGGVGVPPLYYLAKKLLAAGQEPVALLGFNQPEECFYEDEFRALCETKLVIGGYVTDSMKDYDYDALYCCGPEGMLRAVFSLAKELPEGHAQFSFERRMACGFGACMACSCRTAAGYKRICKEGPVLGKEEILWER